MKYIYMLPLIAAAAIMGATGCGNHKSDELAHHHHHHGGHEEYEEHEEHEGHHHNEGDAHESHQHQDIITLHPEIAERFGVHSTEAAVTPVGDVVKVSGIISASADGTATVAAPRAGTVTLAHGITEGCEVRRGTMIATVSGGTVSGSTDSEVAAAELQSARREFERIEALYNQRLVTTTRYNEALSALERAKAAYTSPATGGKAAAPIGGVVVKVETPTGAYVEAGTPIATISSGNALTLIAYLPVRNASMLQSITDARIALPGAEASLSVSGIGGKRLSASAAAATGGYIPVTFSLPAHPSLVPDMAVEVYLQGKPTASAVTVPRSAIYEQQGDYCVFVQLDEDCYVKVPVTTGQSDGDRVTILSGIKVGDRVVDSGITTVRLAGASGAIPAGHSHQH